eukprot:RCo041577
MFELYSNLPAAKAGEAQAPQETAGPSWSGSGKLPFAPIIRKRDPSVVSGGPPPGMPAAPKRARAAASSSGASGISLLASTYGDPGEAPTGSMGDGDATSTQVTSPTSPTGISSSSGSSETTRVAVEYNPAHPNDYEEVLKERRAAQVLRQKEEEMERRRRELQRHDEREGLTPQELTGDDAWRRRAILSGRSPDELPEVEPDPNEPEERKLSAAEKMMKAMGWKEGMGLGKNETGIATPLMHKKLSQTTAQIVLSAPKPQAAPAKKPAMAPPTRKPTKKLRGKPSEVILLRNMVGPGEVDEDLSKETEEECQDKYGGVLECKIFEVKDAEVRPQEAVRIFVKFSSIENAVKAAVDLDGRFFAGKMVCACFYDPRRYDNGELGPDPSEPEMPPEIFSS